MIRTRNRPQRRAKQSKGWRCIDINARARSLVHIIAGKIILHNAEIFEKHVPQHFPDVVLCHIPFISRPNKMCSPVPAHSTPQSTVCTVLLQSLLLLTALKHARVHSRTHNSAAALGHWATVTLNVRHRPVLDSPWYHQASICILLQQQVTGRSRIAVVKYGS